MNKLVIYLSACLLGFAVSGVSVANDLKPSQIRGKAQKKVKPVSVLHSRYFKKALRPELGILGGFIMDEAYIDTKAYGGRFSLFFNEWIGFDVQYLKASHTQTDDFKALEAEQAADLSRTILPELNPIENIIEGSVIAAPFYGKLNFMDKLTVYSDFYVSAGYSRLQTEQGGKNGLNIGLGQRFYLKDFMSLRVDFKDRIFTDQRKGEDFTKHSWYVDFGLSVFLTK